MRQGDAFAPFRQPVFRAIWLATLISNFGAMIQSTGAAWMMTSLTGSPRMVALVQSSATLPIMLLALFAGAVADSYDRRRVMLVAQFVMLAASAALAVLTWLHAITPAVLLVCTLVVGCGTALHGPSWQASIRAQVPIEDLPAAVALNSINFNVARSVGPAVGGALMALFGATANFTLNACSYLGLIVVLLRWKPRFDHPPQREPLVAAIRSGIAAAYATPPVRCALLRGAVFGVTGAGLWALMPLVAHDLLHGTQADFGIILGAFGLGSIAGATGATRARRRFGTERVFAGGTLLYAAGSAGAALSPTLGWTVVAAALAGSAWVTVLSTINVTVQMAAPHAVIGRCLALYHMHAFGGLAVGSFLWGNVAERIGTQTAILLSAAGLFASLLLAIPLPLPGVISIESEEALA
ncbi:MFS transporter [Sphingomonas immobilis]|uniref:MFS transporter n=1 Tax=Sphingomonas immobilis TaxID=3063997 RepID=A0ABT8ZWY5_9SPHN|nr:MFS transporter [Sphingomonas sp. CA1-15]MDO7842086.1 MFS transporter [Sphingomonas sp. CA1-15]